METALSSHIQKKVYIMIISDEWSLVGEDINISIMKKNEKGMFHLWIHQDHLDKKLDRDPKVLGYTLTFSLTQNLGVGWRGGKLNEDTPVAHGTKATWLGDEWSHSILPISKKSYSTLDLFLPIQTTW